jgi:hypothetical protein
MERNRCAMLKNRGIASINSAFQRRRMRKEEISARHDAAQAGIICRR